MRRDPGSARRCGRGRISAPLPFEHPDVPLDHSFDGEPAASFLATHQSIDLVQRAQTGDELCIGVAEETSHTVFHDLGSSTLRATDDGCAARQCFEHCHTERLAPTDRVEERRCRRQQLAFAVSVDLAEVDDVVTEMRDAQVKLANEQARYQIAFREDLADLAERLRRA